MPGMRGAFTCASRMTATIKGDISVNKLFRGFVASLLFGSAMLAVAQDAIRVEVPFDFHVSGRSLPAGTYTVRRVFELDPALLRITGAAGQPPVSFVVNSQSLRQTGSSLSFLRYGDSYVLSGVTTASGKFVLPLSRAERMTASTKTGSEVIVGSK